MAVGYVSYKVYIYNNIFLFYVFYIKDIKLKEVKKV